MEKKKKAEAATRCLTETLIAAPQHGTPQAGRLPPCRGRTRPPAPGSASGAPLLPRDTAPAVPRRAPLSRTPGSGGLEGRGVLTALRRPTGTGFSPQGGGGERKGPPRSGPGTEGPARRRRGATSGRATARGGRRLPLRAEGSVEPRRRAAAAQLWQADMVRPRARPAPPRRRLGLAGGAAPRPTRAVNTLSSSPPPPQWRQRAAARRHRAHAADYRSQRAARGAPRPTLCRPPRGASWEM